MLIRKLQAQLKTILAKHMEMKEEWVEEVSERDYYMKVRFVSHTTNG